MFARKKSANLQACPAIRMHGCASCTYTKVAPVQAKGTGFKDPPLRWTISKLGCLICFNPSLFRSRAGRTETKQFHRVSDAAVAALFGQPF